MHRKLTRLAAASLAGIMLSCASLPAAAADASTPAYVIDSDGAATTCAAFQAEVKLRTGLEASVRSNMGEVPPDACVATGQELMLRGENGAVELTVPLAVRGDVAGTGKAGLTQLVKIGRAAAGREKISGAALQAADFNGSGDIDLSDLVCAAEQLSRTGQRDTLMLNAKVTPTYFRGPDARMDVPLYFIGDQAGIPYVSTSTIRSVLLLTLSIVEATDLTQNVEEDGIITMSRASGSTVAFDFNAGKIAFSNFNTFLEAPYMSTILDPLNTTGLTEEDEAWYFRRLTPAYQRMGRPVELDLGSRGIETPHTGDTGYIPLQTFSDFFLTPFGFQCVYNGEMLGIIAQGELNALTDMYYSVPPRPRSEELARFNYEELCLVLDSYYGLKEQHDITNFDALFTQTGLKQTLLGTDAAAADRALVELTDGYLGDLHTSLLCASSYAGQDEKMTSEQVSASLRDYVTARREFAEASKRAYPDGMPGYEEVGDTAYVTITDLSWYGYDYYTEPPQSADAPDTVGLICYAHRQIMRKNSPIKNVVLDLSNNGGGLSDAAIYVMGWFLGTARLDLNDTFTHGQASPAYLSDVNLDGKFDLNDTVVSKNRYCIISPVSFSCGNLIPAAVKADPEVPLIGQESGGGACLIWALSTADGSTMQISGPIRANMTGNGSYYDIDRGIEPDYYLAAPDQFYDREALSDYLKGLFR